MKAVFIGLAAALSVSCAGARTGMVTSTAVSPGAELCGDDGCRLLRRAFPNDEALASSCRRFTDEHELVNCLLGVRFGEDEVTRELVHRLYDEHGIIAGIESQHVMDDGDYRGRVDLEPRVPVGDDRKHLEGLLEAFASLDAMFGELSRRSTEPMHFVRKPSVIRFFETKNATTPSAYAVDATIAYNLRGECWSSPSSVFETLVHELFHLSDIARGNWSERALKDQYERIRARCQGDQECLDPFAPHETKVDGGIYYAFHPTSDVREYAAELATRFVREQREQLETPSTSTVVAFFKCQTDENGVAWRKLANEFFGGIDLTPPCDGS